MTQRDPADEAAEALLSCATKGPRVLRRSALNSLARVAGRPVPPGKVHAAAGRLAEAARNAPAERIERLAAAYLPPGVPATAEAAQPILKGRIRGKGPDAMNVRELLERLRGDLRRTNLMSPARRRRVWRNRLERGTGGKAGANGAPGRAGDK